MMNDQNLSDFLKRHDPADVSPQRVQNLQDRLFHAIEDLDRDPAPTRPILAPLATKGPRLKPFLRWLSLVSVLFFLGLWTGQNLPQQETTESQNLMTLALASPWQEAP